MPITHQLGGDSNGAVLFAPDRYCNRVIHRDDLLSVDDFDTGIPPESRPTTQGAASSLPVEFRLDLLRSPHKDHSDAEISSRLDGAFNLTGGSVISSHCIHCDLKHSYTENRRSKIEN